MNSFSDIEILWKTAMPLRALPDAAAIIGKASRIRRQVRNKILWQTISLALVIPTMGYLMYAVDFDYISSYIGIGLMLVCVLLFSFFRIKQLRFLSRADFSQAPSALLKEFEKFYVQQQWLHSKGIRWYSIIVNIAFGLYFYETIYMAAISNNAKIILVVAYIAWMFIVTFWIEKISARGELNKTSSIIRHLKRLSHELT
ncbi:MAG: hypothetical protein WAT19_15925 [Ferruginibacter sp.]